MELPSAESKDGLKSLVLLMVSENPAYLRLITSDNSEIIDYLKGTIKINEYVTHSRNLSDINEGFHDMHVCHQSMIR